MPYLVRLTPDHGVELEVSAQDLKQLDAMLRELRKNEVYAALRGAAREFQDAPVPAVETLLQALPGATVLTDAETSVVAVAPEQLAAEAAMVLEHNRLAQERALGKDKKYAADVAEAALKPQLKCHRCGAAATERSGTKNGTNWRGLFCSSGDYSHTKYFKG